LKILAHRGASVRAPENTLAAVRLAAELGADGVEVDVRLTRDGQLAVLHDTDTRRVAPDQPIYTVKRHRLADLQTLDVGSGKDQKFAGERIPAIKDVLNALGPEQEIFIELKSRESVEIMKVLDQALAPPAASGFPAARAVVMSFDEGVVRALKKKRPAWRGLLLLKHKPTTHVYGQILSAIRAKYFDGIGQNRTWAFSEEQYAELREAGAILSVWTVNDPAEAKVWRERGFAYLTSDCPEKFK
jgi:glycerophosphoryl diester phosphodiesterase